MDGKTDMMNPRRPTGVKALCCWHCSYVDWCLQAPSLSIHTQKNTHKKEKDNNESKLKSQLNIHNDAEHLQHLQIHSHVCTGNSICITTETSAVIHINDKSFFLVLFFKWGRGQNCQMLLFFVTFVRTPCQLYMDRDFKPKHDFFSWHFLSFCKQGKSKHDTRVIAKIIPHLHSLVKVQ